MSLREKILRFGLVGVLISAAVFLFVIPHYLPPPRIQLSMPQYTVLSEDLEFTLQVEAWLGNYGFDHVTIIPAGKVSTCSGGKGLFDRVTLQGSGTKRYSGYGTMIGRIPFPRKSQYTFKIPLRELAAKGMIGRGRLAGEVRVDFRYETQRRDPYAPNYSNRSVERRLFQDYSPSTPFEILIQ